MEEYDYDWKEEERGTSVEVCWWWWDGQGVTVALGRRDDQRAIAGFCDRPKMVATSVERRGVACLRATLFENMSSIPFLYWQSCPRNLSPLSEWIDFVEDFGGGWTITLNTAIKSK